MFFSVIFPQARNVFYLVLPEQYNTTKISWMADYCNEEEQTPHFSPPLLWMGSSVDPPNTGQSEFQLHTVPWTNHWVVKIFTSTPVCFESIKQTARYVILHNKLFIYLCIFFKGYTWFSGPEISQLEGDYYQVTCWKIFLNYPQVTTKIFLRM